MADEQAQYNKFVDFNIDRHLNPFIPHSRLHRLPAPVSRWLGHRTGPHTEPPALLQWPVSFAATVGALSLVASVYQHAPGIAAWQPPALVASLGASAVLDYTAIRSPLAQPRNAVLGNALAAVCGVAVTKLFRLSADFERLSWLAGAVACAVATLAMSATNTVHPPGGATAVLAAVEAQVVAMGWRYVPLIIVSTCLMTAVALVFNNVLRQYPVCWWTPEKCGGQLRREREVDVDVDVDVEKRAMERASSSSSSERTLHDGRSSLWLDQVVVGPGKIQLPPLLELSDTEAAALEAIQRKLLNPQIVS